MSAIASPTVAQLTAAPVGSRLIFSYGHGVTWVLDRIVNGDGQIVWHDPETGRDIFYSASLHPVTGPKRVTLHTPNLIRVHSWLSVDHRTRYWVWACRACADFDMFTDAAAAHTYARRHAAVCTLTGCPHCGERVPHDLMAAHHLADCTPEARLP